MRSADEIFRFLCSLAPLELQADFDNAGFLVGRKQSPVNRVLLSLDITDAVIDEATERGADLIVAHHPVIFHKLSAVTDAGEDDKVLRLAENRIAAICMHTNLDIADGGVNDVLMERLGAQVEAPLDGDGCGRVGVLPEETDLNTFLARCRTVLKAPGLRFVSGGRPVRRLAVMGGSGGDALETAYECGCDTYVTADVKYHQFLRAAEAGINLIDADHFCTEDPVIHVLQEKLSAAFPELEFRISERHGPVIRFYGADQLEESDG